MNAGGGPKMASTAILLIILACLLPLPPLSVRDLDLDLGLDLDDTP